MFNVVPMYVPSYHVKSPKTIQVIVSIKSIQTKSPHSSPFPEIGRRNRPHILGFL